MLKIKRSSIIVVDHPSQLLLACNLSTFLSNEYGYRSKLLIFKHEYWKYFHIGKYKKFFSKIYWFDRCWYPPPHMNIFKQLVSSILLLPQLFYIKIKLISIGVKKRDIIFGLSNCTFLEDLVISTFRDSKKIAMMFSLDYNFWLNRPNSDKFGTNLSIEITQLIRYLFGLPKTLFLYNKKVSKLGDGDYYFGYEDKINKIFDALLLIYDGHKITNKNLQDKNVYTATFPHLINMNFSESTKKKIIFLGSDFLIGNNADQKVFIYEINQYLDYLRRLYSSKYILVYKPHPRETLESTLLNLKGFVKINDKRPAEIFFIENKKNIKSVFSVVSTAILSSYSIGIDGYLFLNLFPFDEVRSSIYNKLFSNLPRSCFIDNLEAPPKPVIKKNGSNIPSFSESLHKLLKNI